MTDTDDGIARVIITHSFNISLWLALTNKDENKTPSQKGKALLINIKTKKY